MPFGIFLFLFFLENDGKGKWEGYTRIAETGAQLSWLKQPITRLLCDCKNDGGHLFQKEI